MYGGASSSDQIHHQQQKQKQQRQQRNPSPEKPTESQTTRTTTAQSTISAREREMSPADLCLARGPNGPPTYDRFGYELDYKKIARASRRPRVPRAKRYEEWQAREDREEARKADIMGGPDKNQRSAMTFMLWDDRVSRDLGIPYHKIELRHFEEWWQAGFRAKREEFIATNVPKEACDSVTDLATGSTFRK
ncbi:hypothetical protein VTN00DRAFT_8246 [Thermoascus crustaceus]|uniref:uncharacterized protein n=1 Tax=Thermoascus crustaceus TaxID=5088 RepID=UPI003743D310